jgi:hypothetical protein
VEREKCLVFIFFPHLAIMVKYSFHFFVSFLSRFEEVILKRKNKKRRSSRRFRIHRCHRRDIYYFARLIGPGMALGYCRRKSSGVKLTTLWRWLSSGMLHLIVRRKLTDVSVVVTASIVALVVEAVSISETSVSSYQATRRNIPEASHLYARRRENLKSHSVTRHLKPATHKTQKITFSCSSVCTDYG